MTQGPPCPNCGSLLRWYPDQQQWGCDRCRVMYPPQVMVQPQVYASGGLHRGHRARRTSHGRVLMWNKPVIYGLAGLLFVGGVVITLFIIHRGKPHPERETAVHETSGVLDQPPADAAQRAIVPVDADVPPKAPDVTTEPPVPTGVADFWIAPRSDGSFVVTSPVVTAVFPTRPELKVAPSSRPNADGKPFDIYTISAPPYELQLIAMGRNMRDEGGFKNLEAELRKLGKVKRVNRVEDGKSITRFTVGHKFALDGRLDLVHGLIINSSVNGAQTPAADAFLKSIQVKTPPDPIDDPDVLTGVRQRKGAKAKLIVHDPDDHFTVEIPFNAKIERKVDTDAHAVVVTIKKKNTVVTIDEVAAWDALAIGPTKLAELQAKAKPKAHLVWNAFQHRMFRVECAAEAPCDPIVKSLHFSDPEPPK